ncbi:DUF1990 family protein [Nocardioides limicola]|uniref:DUF1990 family protein n=1 Tax=Nocardioides limicola TaxID=2803368 RepID=UPI00193BAEA2|nr:DUF1990 domain-containing protein [Nocardioides sp. DJM-14]
MALRSRPSLAEKALSYRTVGVTLDEDRWHGDTHAGYQRRVRIGTGTTHWEFAAAEILRWGVKTRSGFTVEGGDTVVAGDRCWLVAHIGPLRIHEPVQVVGVIDEADRKGFAYGTLSGHPVSGEELFLVEQRDDGSVWLTLRSVTHPPKGRWRAIYPLALVAQRFYRRRYLRSLA